MSHSAAPALGSDARALDLATGEAQVRLAGAGGQGVVLAGLLLAEAAVRAGRNATHAQAYGPESRGGASKADVIVADGEIDYPYASAPHVLLAFTQEAAEKFAAEVRPGGLVIADARIQPPAVDGLAWRSVPLFATARQVLSTLTGANVLALGVLVGLTGVVPAEAMEASIAARWPGAKADPSLRAFRAGLDLSARAAEG